MTTIQPVILCGGSGTRLWPSSREAFPKQFASLVGPESLYQATLRRFAAPGFAAPLVMTGEPFRFLAREQAEALGLLDARIVLEPVARNTAPAILVAALMLENSPDTLMLVAPSDHLIGDEAAFHAAVRAGVSAAEAGQLVAFGVPPERAETGYGYLRLAEAAETGRAVPLEDFVEKPDPARAEAMAADGRHLWNAGIFLFRVADILAAFEAHAHALVAPCRAALEAATEDLGFLRLGSAYGEAEKRSFDYAVMERAEGLSAVPISAGWSDLGSWPALLDAKGPDDDGNVTEGAVTAVDCTGSYLRSEEAGLHLVGLGLHGVVAVAMRDAVLVADIERAQEVKGVVERLGRAGVPQARDYPRFHRPWGWYETLCLDSRFQVKRIMVRPGGILSLQSHVHRSEHWVVVAGTARVTIGDEVRLLSENQSVYIPLGVAHRMENPGKVPMFLIEVQTGTYLGEDDIVRYEDVYDRA